MVGNLPENELISPEIQFVLNSRQIKSKSVGRR